MRLERLEIAGFKSFSDRSELAFDRGVTAIVGPNGCGKSNVADAITWVLGEQSAKSLRGERMEDVIFSGSDARKPTATAEVRLRLAGVTSVPSEGAGNGNGHGAYLPAEPTDQPPGDATGPLDGDDRAAPAAFTPVGRDVELIRRLYRSGESEYLIDGEHCRLKDIHELLMDTGLGAKAYAIIEQGKIGMILSSRPTDRRQLIEEAAGITKYKARRRSAELKLDAAQQNLTRIDDIVFEVEKQRGSLKRQAAKARRYQRLRDELRRWEKVLFARRYRELAAAIEATRRRLADAREREQLAAARLAETEAALGMLRIEVAEADGHATSVRDRTHAHELEIRRTEQQVELNRQQIGALGARVAEIEQELAGLEARREPQQAEVAARREAAALAEEARTAAAGHLTAQNEAYQLAAREIEGLESDVETARREVFGAISQATALQNAIDNAMAARERAEEALSRLDVEETDLRVESQQLAEARLAADEGLAGALAALSRARDTRAGLDAELTRERAAHASLDQALRGREHDLAALSARLTSLEELEAARAGFTEAARVVLAEANGSVQQHGAVADWLDVDRRYERAVEALAGDLLQHVVVPSHAHATSGLQLLREQEAGRCGFLVLADPVPERARLAELPGLRRIAEVARGTGPYAGTIDGLLPRGYVADSFEAAVAAARATGATVATLEGDLVRGSHIVVGGGRHEGRGILAAKGEIRELRTRITAEREQVAGLVAELAAAASTVAGISDAIQTTGAELHEHEKAIVGLEAAVARTREDAARLERKGETLTAERRRADEEIGRLDERHAEARESIVSLEVRKGEAESGFDAAQQRLVAAREQVGALSHRAAEARASHAALVERATAVAADVVRLEEAARELLDRLESRTAEKVQKLEERAALDVATSDALSTLDRAVAELDVLRQEVRAAEEAASVLRTTVDAEEGRVKAARADLDTVRSIAAELEIARATSQSDLGHLQATCEEAVHASLPEVLAEVDELERNGAAVPDTRALEVGGDAEEVEDLEESEPRFAPVDGGGAAAAVAEAPPAPPRVITAEDAIAGLREKIDRLGPVNMMAIEQFDELEARHEFLTTQRRDLVDSIAATNEAIKRIDETSKVRFHEAFEAINRNFQETFSTLFGGGRAGITLLDETDPLESGIDIVASPPGKRLQSVQLLSGGEKALTAIALMFAIFKFKPSPFCLLDEIDAPLDDANIGRFVEMLKGLLHHTQFILITHNRKTMEIADRLYGVTMEEPGVSKLISVHLN
jgi:chromosome segregation protein